MLLLVRSAVALQRPASSDIALPRNSPLLRGSYRSINNLHEQLSHRFLDRGGTLQQLNCLTDPRPDNSDQGTAGRARVIAKSIVNTLAVDFHVFDQILDRRVAL
jgi:hypothetical protein